MIIVPLLMSAQSATEAYLLTRHELYGTARYMSMGGAFGALGGDLSAIQLNPGGIGVYRRSDVGISLNLNMQSAKTQSGSEMSERNQTKFFISNIGYVGTIEFNSGILPFLNYGITYNRPISYNHRYGGRMVGITNSLTNYIANYSNSRGYNTYDLKKYDQDIATSWLSTMAYKASIINPKDFDEKGYGYNFMGLYNNNSSAFNEYEVIEEGGVNEFNLHIGGNISNVAYWGASIGLNNMNFNKYSFYGETIDHATVVNNANGDLSQSGTASFGLQSTLKTSGNGWNYKVGIIMRPINEIRLGVSIHSPTYWTLTDNMNSSIQYKTANSTGSYVKKGETKANGGNDYSVRYKFRSPLKFNLSAAAVLSDKSIVSLTYERVLYNNMIVKYETPSGFITDRHMSEVINSYYKGIDVLRVGTEYRIIPSISVRLGYCYQSSPVIANIMNKEFAIETSDLLPSYLFEKSTQYYTCGLGLKFGDIYSDFAYVLKTVESEYNAYSPYNAVPSYETSYKLTPAPSATVKDRNGQIVWTIGYRF